MPSLSGMSDMDYPLQGPGLISVPSLPELSAIRRVPLPPELVEQFGHMQCNCMMGVFPEISRAWLTIDNDIFMWNYEDGSDVAYFDGLSETILSVGLVRPKPGIFQPHIHFLLVLATPVDVVILGLSFPKAHTGAMQLLPDPLYSIPTDNTYLLAITSTDVGRIFMAGKDGCLYEIDPVVQIAVDNSRNILYTRSEKGVLQVYDLGADGQGMSRVAAMSQSSIVSAAGNIARTIDRSVFKPIVQIAVIDRPESSDCVRLYFSTIPFAPPNAKHISARPSILALVHVRLPPGFSVSSTLQKPAKVHKALYSKGVLLMAASEAEDSDVLWCINHDSFPFKKPLMEAQMTVNVDGHSWALCPIEETKSPRILTPLNKDLVPVTDSPLVVQQHSVPPQKFVLLSAQGSHIFHKLRPVDQLRHLLVSSAGGESEEIERFFKLHGEGQACATALILACSSAACDREVSVWATRAFFRYGGEAQMRFPSAISAPSNVGPLFSSPVPGSPMSVGSPLPNPSFLATPAPARQANLQQRLPGHTCVPMAPAAQQVQARSSRGSTTKEPRYEKASLRPMQAAGSSLVNQTLDALEAFCVTNQFKPASLRDAAKPNELLAAAPEHNPPQNKLEKERDAVKELPALSISRSATTQTAPRCFSVPQGMFPPSVSTPYIPATPMMPSGAAITAVSSGPEVIFSGKHNGISIYFTRILGFSSPANLQQRLLGYMRPDGSSSQQVQQELQRKYHTEAQVYEKASLQAMQQLVHRSYQTLALWKLLCDHQFSLIISEMPKANELLQGSRQIQNKLEKERTLKESLRLYQQISHHTDLPLVCSQYRQVRFYEGVVELCLTAADKKDPQKLGLHFYRNGEPEEDSSGQQAFQQRLCCFKCITDTMQELVNQSKAAPQSPSVPKQPGPPVMTSDPNMLSNEDAAAH
ncbi:hypothetical protein cypCar_00039544, partial [Cyprinus carpio]